MLVVWYHWSALIVLVDGLMRIYASTIHNLTVQLDELNEFAKFLNLIDKRLFFRFGDWVMVYVYG